jgi:hypothetical protein
MPDKGKLRAYTYGLSPRQEECFEVVISKALCNKLGVQWQQIELGDFHQYFDEWNRIFGIPIHAHGMYHIEFFQKIIKESSQSAYHPLSGIGGTFGTFKKGAFSEVQSADEVKTLMRFHGMNADSRFSKLSADNNAQFEYFEKNFEKLKTYRNRKIEVMRFDLILLGFLIRLPEALGMKVFSPLLEIDVATATLNLPEERRKNKQWLRDYFRKTGIDFTDLANSHPYKNTLNFQAIKRLPPPPLNRALFEEIIEADYIDWINRNLNRFDWWQSKFWDFTRLPKINRVLKWVNIVDERKAAYFAYLTLKPIEYALKKTQPEKPGNK